MESLPLKHQLKLRELLVLYDNLIEEIEKNGLNKDIGQRLHNVYHAMRKVSGDAWSGIPELNN